jgi:hypothetical protein
VNRRSLAAVATVAAVWAAVACLDVSSPVSGITAITTVLLPTPSVVVNDSLRDTLGNAQPLVVYAFAPNGDTVRDATVRFFAIDSTQGLHVDSATGYAWGDSLSPLAKVVARVTPANGKGTIQTLQVPLPVVPIPVGATKAADALIDFPFDPTTLDTLGAGVLSPSLDVTVVGQGDTPIQSYIVSYRIDRSPVSASGKPSVAFLDRSGNDSTIAVTSTTGTASRQLRVRLADIPQELRFPPATDTVVVRVRVFYHGQLVITPSDSFKLVLRPKF